MKDHEAPTAAGPLAPRLTEGLGTDVTAWVCEYISGEVFVSLARDPMNDPDVRKAWRLLTMAQRDAQVAAAVAAERERCAPLLKRLEDIAFGVTLYGAPDGSLLAQRIERVCLELRA